MNTFIRVHLTPTPLLETRFAEGEGLSVPLLASGARVQMRLPEMQFLPSPSEPKRATRRGAGGEVHSQFGGAAL